MAREGSGEAPPPEQDGVGQICATNPIQMMGYWKNPAKTQETHIAKEQSTQEVSKNAKKKQDFFGIRISN